ncbi:MAG: PspA/IM30 family protein [Pseudomonadota bacterium]
MFQTLGTLFRARAAEAEETLIDRNAVTLLAQHLRDAKAEIARARAAVARLMAREAERGRALDRLAEDILKREREATAAMEAGREDLAADLADAILAMEDRKAAEETAQRDLARRVAEARERLAENEARLADLADQLRAARDASLARIPQGAAPTASALDRAVETAEALKARDARLEDLEDAYRRMDAETPANSLDARVEDAGLDKEKEARRAALMKRLQGKGDRK